MNIIKTEMFVDVNNVGVFVILHIIDHFKFSNLKKTPLANIEINIFG